MGNRKANSKKLAQEETEQPASRSKSGRNTTNAPALARTAIKAVAAVAVGVGGVLSIARRRARTKNSSPESPSPERQAVTAPDQNASVPPPAPFPSLHEFDHEAVALRAYYLSEERRAAGLPDDPRRDWLDAERELRFAIDHVA